MLSASRQLTKISGSYTPLLLNSEMVRRHGAQIYLKHEDKGIVRSYKWRGAYNNLVSSDAEAVVTCSAGNHAQGVAFACQKLGKKGYIFMPTITPQQKINKVKQFGGDSVEIFLEGGNFDESFVSAKRFADMKGTEFIHPFDNKKVIEGQSTVGVELFSQMGVKHIDYLFLPIGGGGLAAGVSSYIKLVSPDTKIIGVEPLGAPSMTAALKAGTVVGLDKINTFVDGASVKRVGELNYPICRDNLDDVLLIDEGHVCSKIIQMYNECGFIIEPAGVLALCALDMYPRIKDSNVVCIVSGGNSDIFRMPEILEKSLVYEGLKHYFKIHFAQKAGSLKKFVLEVLGPNDDIIYFRYTQLINKEHGPVIIGLQVSSKGDIDRIIKSLECSGLDYEKLPSLTDV